MSVLAVATIAGCGAKAKTDTTAPADPSVLLYDRLGRRDAIAAVVKDFVEERVAKDARINAFFHNVDSAGLETQLVDQICEVSGGPCKYTGKDMKAVHASMNVKEADFGALVEDLKAALAHAKVGEQEQNDLLGALAKMHDDIVTAK